MGEFFSKLGSKRRLLIEGAPYSKELLGRFPSSMGFVWLVQHSVKPVMLIVSGEFQRLEFTFR